MGVEKARTEKVWYRSHTVISRRAAQLDGWTLRLVSGNLSQHQGSILRPESHTVTNGVLDLSLAIDIGNIIEVALRIRSIEIDRRRHPAMLHGNHRRRNTGRAASTLGMTDLRFQSGHRNTLRMFAESQF